VIGNYGLKNQSRSYLNHLVQLADVVLLREENMTPLH